MILKSTDSLLSSGANFKSLESLVKIHFEDENKIKVYMKPPYYATVLKKGIAEPCGTAV